MDDICSGWLEKSPPEKKIQGHWFGRIFQSKWRRRFFVLHQPSAKASLPGSHVLEYFDNEHPQKRKRLGSIDLDQCEEILATLDSVHYQHLFALKTKHKARDRTYYLAANTESEMNKWVECLCNVCGFKPDPKEQALQSANSSSLEEWPVQSAPPVQPVQSSPARSVSSLADQQSLQHSDSSSTTTPVRRPSTQESYIPLGECYSDSRSAEQTQPGRKTNTSPLDQVPPPPGRRRRGSTDSIPEMMAPAPPNKTGERIELMGDPQQTYDQPSKSYVNIDVFEQDDGVYKVPPRRSLQPDPNQGFYKVPPSKHMEFKDSTDGWQQVPVEGSTYQQEMEYDVPPPQRPTPARRGSNQRDSGSSSSSRGSHRPETGLSVDSFYDCPRSQGGDSQKAPLYTNQETYDVPPARRTAPLENVPPPPRPAKSQIMPGPQMPYQNIPTNSKSAVFPSRSLDQTYDTPRKPSDVEILSMSPPPPQPHTAPRLHGYVNSVAGYPPPSQHESLYLPMQGGGPAEQQQLYLPMNEHGFYTDMSGVQSIYTAPPSNKPVPSRATSTTPPRLQRLQVAQTEVDNGDSYAIVSTSRTKSFKRQPNHLPMPTRRPTIAGHEDTSDDDSDGEERKNQLENLTIKSVQAADPTGGNKTSLNSTPPPPQRSGEIQYLDLYHEDNSDAEKPPCSAFATVPPPGNITPTDYKEIDFIKTKALSDTRKDLESKRKSSERSVDE